jgi:hypothetical protein
MNQREIKREEKNAQKFVMTLICPDLGSREELVDFLRWKGSTHIIDRINATRTNQNGQEQTN